MDLTFVACGRGLETESGRERQRHALGACKEAASIDDVVGTGPADGMDALEVVHGGLDHVRCERRVGHLDEPGAKHVDSDKALVRAFARGRLLKRGTHDVGDTIANGRDAAVGALGGRR
jgi:hypothetical protein